jgi:hypothetical protein
MSFRSSDASSLFERKHQSFVEEFMRIENGHGAGRGVVWEEQASLEFISYSNLGAAEENQAEVALSNQIMVPMGLAVQGPPPLPSFPPPCDAHSSLL